jgi:SAM-dependent methyltransferase
MSDVILGALAANGITALNQLNMLQLHTEALSEQLRQAEAKNFLWRRVQSQRHAEVAGLSPAPQPRPIVLQEQLERLRSLAPLNFDMWMDRFRAGEEEYRKQDASSLSVINHPEAFYFGLFITLHGRGNLLDVGVGPLEIPSYLANWPRGHIAAIDPLAAYSEHPFPFARAVVEELPWPDESFETVVSATSLDHFYLLDVALDEIVRVLKPGGRFLLWSAVFAKTAPYDPYSGIKDPPDAYHLFHPGENWFPELLTSRFRVIERLDIARIGFNNSYFALEPLQASV